MTKDDASLPTLSTMLLSIPIAPPVLLSAKVSHSRTIHGHDSHIGRLWDFSQGGVCHLCPVCTADEHGFCQVQVNTYVDENDAADFSVVAFLNGR